MAFVINLKQYGFDMKVELQGHLVDQHLLEGAPLVFLIDEYHDFGDGIRQSLRNACRLFDAGILDFAGVEGYPDGVREQLEEECASIGFTTEKVLQRFPDAPGRDDALIEA